MPRKSNHERVDFAVTDEQWQRLVEWAAQQKLLGDGVKRRDVHNEILNMLCNFVPGFREAERMPRVGSYNRKQKK